MIPSQEPVGAASRHDELLLRDARRLTYALLLFAALVLLEPLLLASVLRMGQREADVAQLALSLAIRWFGLFFIVVTLRKSSPDGAKRLLVPARYTILSLCFIGGFGAAILLNQLGLWPFPWRYYRADAIAFASQVSQLNPIVQLLWLSNLVFVIPVQEEIYFRLGLLQSLLGRPMAPIVAMIVSSIAFGALHLGYPFYQPSPTSIKQAITATSFGFLLAYLTVKNHGNLSFAIAVHAGRNAADVAVLMMLGA